MLMRLRMLKLSVGKGRQTIKQLYRRVLQYYIRYSGYRARGVCALQSSSLILILITAVFVSVTVLLIQSKRLMQKELKDIKESQDNTRKGNTVYDEIKPLPESTIIETTENTAYTCISRVCANASL